VPSLVVDGVATPILHVSQLAPLLDLPVPAALEAPGLAWDASSLLGSWVDLVGDLDWARLTYPTPSRGRSLRNLTVNVFHPFELLPEAWGTKTFAWDPDLDEQRERRFGDALSLVAYARERHNGWVGFLLEAEHELGDASRVIRSPRGDITYANLLAQQRWHAAFHYRQLVAVREAAGLVSAGTIDVTVMASLELPADVF
jgi:hypothetical protein